MVISICLPCCDSLCWNTRGLWDFNGPIGLHNCCSRHILPQRLLRHGSLASRKNYHGDCKCPWSKCAECVLGAGGALVYPIVSDQPWSISNAGVRLGDPDCCNLRHPPSSCRHLSLLFMHIATMVRLRLSCYLLSVLDHCLGRAEYRLYVVAFSMQLVEESIVHCVAITERHLKRQACPIESS